MGKLNGTQHLMKAAGIDPENPVGSLLEKAGINPADVLNVAKAIPELLKGFEARQQRMENGLAEIAANQARIIALLEGQRALPPGDITPVASDVDDLLDKLHTQNLEAENAEGAISH
jgi:hypothetical protein